MQVRASLQRKLVVLVAASIGIATVVSTSIGLWQQALSFVESRKQALVATAQVFAAAAAQAAAAHDDGAAFAVIRGMGRVRDIHYAEIRTATGRSLASFGAVARLVDDVSISGDQDVSLWRMLRSGTIEVSVPITDGGVQVGRFALIGGMSDLPRQLVATATLTALGGAAALVVGLFVAWRFQRRITRPLQGLLRAMTRVREEGHYDITAARANDREIGELVDGFNHMLGGIRERDQRLEAHARNLEGEVAARTADLSVARDAAEAANRAKSDFLATMSHEIRTPMNGIMVMADLLAQADLPRRQRRFADVIAKSGKSLLAIINDVLDFSKIEAGKLELERLPVDVNGLAENVTSLFAERAREKGIDLAAFVDPCVPRTITSDPVRLGQVVSNLVNNALKFTERGCVRVTIQAEQQGHALRIAISDTGIGIPEDKFGTIFESFSQADHSTTRNFGGTGLGLTISQRLAHALGGKITVESRLGHGSTFSMILPIDDVSGDPGWPQADQNGSRDVRCVLDVGGEATRTALAAYFSASGLAVVERVGGLASDDRVAFLCVDIDKVDLYQSDRGRSFLVAVSAQGDGRADDLLAAGKVDACLTRPVLRSEVEDVLRRICRGDRSITPAPVSHGTAPPTLFAPFRALVADDNAVNREVASAALAQLNATVVTVQNGLEAVEAATKADFDIVFMDGSMPVMDGFEAARRIRAAEADAARRVPIVALTAHVVGAGAEAWRQAGMDAVVHKPFTVAVLAQTIERLLPQVAGGKPQEAASQVEADAARHDGDALDTTVLDQLRQLQANGQTGFVRKILGLYVAHAPDAVTQIRQAAGGRNPAECARAAHALKSMSYNVGARLMSSLAAEIETLAKLHGRAPDGALLFSLDRALGITMEAIARQAELSESGRAGLDEGPPEAGQTLGEALARAIERNELSVHYQPIVDRAGSATVGVEALLRWKRDGKFISPAEFIPLAESNGTIHQIGEWALRQACTDARAWPGVMLSVNVSAVQFRAADLAERIERIVNETGFEWKRLELEITETALLTAEDAVLSVMKRLKEKGVSVSLDDFGTGYSSLTYLRRFRFDKIKIDRSFIADLALTVNATIVHAIVSIGRSLGLKVVAEGVEDARQHQFLAAAGVHYLQGYLFGRPVALAAMSDRLGQERHAERSA